MFLVGLALRSLRARLVISLLTVASIALSVALLVGIEHVRSGVRESFAGTIRGTDLIVGARGGTTQVLLSTVFGMAAPSGSIQWSTYARWSQHPAVAWTIPYALGESRRLGGGCPARRQPLPTRRREPHREQDVVPHREVGDQVEHLEDVADMGGAKAIARGPAHATQRFVEHVELTARGHEHAREQAQQRGLAAAAGSMEEEPLAAHHAQGRNVEDVRPAAIAEPDIVQLDGRRDRGGRGRAHLPVYGRMDIPSMVNPTLP